MSKRVSHISIFIFYIVFFLLVYSPVIRGHYFLADDYFWQGRLLPIILLKAGIAELGRPLTGLLLYEIFDYIKFIDSANTIRLLGVIGIGLFGFIINIIFKTFRVNTLHAFLLSILICTLPAFQVYVAWLVCVPYAYSAVLSAMSALIIFRVVFIENKVGTISSVIAIVTSIVLLIIALSIYQSSAVIYWSMAVIPLVMLRGQDFRPKWYRPYLVYTFIGCIAMSTYYILIKIMLHIMNIELAGRGAFIGITDVSGKIKWFLSNPLHHALNLWNIHTSYIITVFVGILIITGILCEMFQGKNKENPVSYMNYIGKYLLITSALILSFSPNLLILENSGQYRTIVALSMILCVLFCYSIISIGSFLGSYSGCSVNLKKGTITLLLLVLTIMSTYLSYNNVNKYIVWLQSTELNYVENVIREYGISNLSEVQKIYAINPKLYRVRGVHYEFGNPSSNALWARVAMIKIALHEHGIERSIPIIHEDSLSNIPEDNNALVVDFNKLQFVFDKILQ